MNQTMKVRLDADSLKRRLLPDVEYLLSDPTTNPLNNGHIVWRNLSTLDGMRIGGYVHTSTACPQCQKEADE